jgi:hypothetical protein
MKELLCAGEILTTKDTGVLSGFNTFVYGGFRAKFSDGFGNTETGRRIEGYDIAKDMAKDGKIAFIHPFRCECGGYPCIYGGFFVCEKCGNKNVEKEWWKIIVEKDGDQFCCHGLDFENLQESDNYAFGNTFEDAIQNYGLLFNRYYM